MSKNLLFFRFTYSQLIIVALVFLVWNTKAEDAIYALNSPVKAGHMEWNIKEAKKTPSISSDLGELAAGSDETILVVVSGTVTNRSKEEDATLGGNLYLLDDSKTKYGESDEAATVAKPLSLDSFNPNVPKKFSTVFEVPKTAKGLKLMVTDFAVFGATTVPVDLGLDSK
jgi:hypothetical protein